MCIGARFRSLRSPDTEEKPDAMDELLTVEEVASYLRVSRSTVWRWCQAKKVPAFKIGREWRISEPVLEGLVAAQQQLLGSPEAATGPPKMAVAHDSSG